MSEGSIEVMRESSRNFLVLNRRKNRDEESDIRRSMTNLRFDSETVLSIAQKLKTKSMMTVSELQMLKNALLDDESNIQIVLNTNGALRGLVRELTGHDVNKQCAAAGCCCNLALGDGRAGVAVSKSAGTYLVAALDNLTTELAVTSAWTLGNLAGCGLKACELLVAQGAVAKLVELLDSTNEEMKDAVLYALVRFAHQLKNDLKAEHICNMMSKLPYQEVNSSSQLLFILSCHSEFTPDLISKDLISKILQYLLVNIEQVENDNITYIFRFFANSYSKEIFEEVLCYLVNNDMLLLIKLLLEINESVLWFVGNAFKLCSDNVFFEMLFR